MRTLLLTAALFGFIVPSNSQIITTIAGNGAMTNTGDGGPASAATIDYPSGGVFDRHWNYYVGLGDRGNGVREIDAAGIISTLAGTGTMGYSGDNGAATAAELNNVQAVTVDTIGNVYVADAGNNRIRKVNVSTGIITTICGTGVGGYNGDGIPATAAEIYDPLSLCFDKRGNLYVSEYGNSRVRKINTSGIISTVAGNGTSGYGNTGVPATSVSLAVWGICTDNSDNLYIADDYARVFKVDTFGMMTYYAGNGTSGYSGDGGPATAAAMAPFYVLFDKFGNFYIVEYEANRVRMVNHAGIINTIAGTGVTGFYGDGGPATAAEFDSPDGIAIDSCNNLYIGDLNNYRIRKITYSLCDVLAVDNFNEKSAIAIFPNPATNFFTVSNNIIINLVTVTNIFGSIVTVQQCNSQKAEINIESFPPGLYLVTILDKEGNKTVRKIVKE